jgi:hypothetical protein
MGMRIVPIVQGKARCLGCVNPDMMKMHGPGILDHTRARCTKRKVMQMQYYGTVHEESYSTGSTVNRERATTLIQNCDTLVKD